MEAPRENFWADPEAYGVVDPDAPDAVEQWLARFRDATLLVLAVVAHGHGISARDICRATGRLRGSVLVSLRSLRRAGLVERERRAGPDYWFATTEGARLGVVPYVTRLLRAAVPRFRGSPSGGWSVGRFAGVGTMSGPPIFSPAATLAGVNDPEALAEVIRTGVEDDRAYAVTKLVALNDPASVPVLCEVAERRGDDEPLARQAVIALGSFSSQRAIDLLTGIAANRDSFLREAAARSLGRLHATEAIPTLIELIDYPSAPVRAAAVTALGRIGEPNTAAAIAAALTDRDGSVRRSARHALVQLGAEDQLKSNPSRARPLRSIDAKRARAATARHGGT